MAWADYEQQREATSLHGDHCVKPPKHNPMTINILRSFVRLYNLDYVELHVKTSASLVDRAGRTQF